MPKSTTIRRGLGLSILLLLVSALPADAICTAARLIQLVESDSNFLDPQYIYTPGQCVGGYPCAGGGTSVTSQLDGDFWVLGEGDVQVGAGIDSGAFPVLTSGYPSVGSWQSRGWMLAHAGYPVYMVTHWAATQRIDNCPDMAQDRCMGIVLRDWVEASTVPGETGPQSYFRLLTGDPTPIFNYEFDSPTGTHQLAAVPAPVVGAITAGNGAFETTVTAPVLPSAGLQLDAQCPAAAGTLGGYRVYETRRPQGASVPTSRDKTQGWRPAQGGSLPGAAPIPAGVDASIQLACSAAPVDVYLAVEFVFDGGFTTFLGANSPALQVGACSSGGRQSPLKSRHAAPRRR